MTLVFRPHRHLCPDADLRDAMTDAEFWDHVFGNGPVDEYVPDELEHTIASLTPCLVCGEHGACGYDNEGRPLIHTTDEVDP